MWVRSSGHRSSVKSAARMNSAVVLFLEKVEQVNRLVEPPLPSVDPFRRCGVRPRWPAGRLVVRGERKMQGLQKNKWRRCRRVRLKRALR